MRVHVVRTTWLSIPLWVLFGAACASAGPAAVPEGGGAPQPHYGGVIRLATEEDTNDYDPSTQASGVSWTSNFAHARLLGAAYGPGLDFEERRLVGDLAEQWELSPDTRVFTFRLRKDAKFAALPPVNGRDVTSEDVAWSYEYLSRTGRFKDAKLKPSQKAFMFDGLERVETPDPQTAIVRFKEANSPFLNYAGEVEVMARENFDEATGALATNVGAGPFQHDAAGFQKGTRWVYKKNPGYFQPGLPYADEVQVLYLQDAAMQAAFVAQQVDIEAPIGETQAHALKGNNGNVAVFDRPSSRYMHFYMNSRSGPLSDLRIRRAFSLAIDRDDHIKTMYGGKGAWALAGGTRAMFSDEEVKGLLKYDPEQAKRLVSEAGYPNGVDIDWMITKEYGDHYISRAELLQAQVKKANINLVLRMMSGSVEINAIRRTASGHMITATHPSTPPDMGFVLERNYMTGASSNYSGTSDPELDVLIRAQRAEADAGKRRELLRQAIKLVNVDKVWGQALTYEPLYTVWHNHLGNVHPNVFAGRWRVRLEHVWREGN